MGSRKGDSVGRRETCMSFTSNCISPRWIHIISRFFHGDHKKYSKKNNYITSPTHLLSSQQYSGGHDSLNLGIGFGLIYVLNATKNELNKIVEIRKEMEILLQNSKMDYFQKQARIRSKYDDDSEEFGSSCRKIKGNNIQRNLEMKELEEELEVELQRLHLIHLDSPTHLPNAEINMVDHYSSSEGSVCSPNSDDVKYYNGGVPAEELRRKLHEVIESRQEERIKELELALESSMQKLEEKQKEVCWWRDTANLISQHACSNHHLPS